MHLKIAALVFAGLSALATIAPLPAAAKTDRECNAEYAANNAVIKSARQKKADYIAACKAESDASPKSSPAPQAAPSTATPAQTRRVETSPHPTPTRAAVPAGAGGFPSEQVAKSRCPTDTVVWVNTSSGVYHFAGTHNYGTTKAGSYMFEADAKTAGDRAAKNEKHS